MPHPTVPLRCPPASEGLLVRTTRPHARAFALLLPWLAACGAPHELAAAYAAPQSGSGAESYAPPPLPSTPMATGAPAASAPQRQNWSRRHKTADAPTAEAAPPAPPSDRAPALEPQQAEAETASDAVQTGPLLVYTASFLLSVYEVHQTQAKLKEQVAALGGFVSMQTDTQITLRVPAPKFEQALVVIEQAGKVRARQLQALDVGDEYRDLELRLHTAELLRQRLEIMLARAEKVADAMQVQAELERIVREIEQLKGALRSFNDRLAYSTIVVEFRPEARPDIDDSEVIRLPFPFLDQLGLHHLLELSP